MTAPPAREPELRMTWTDPLSGRQAFAVIDRLVGGVALGGTRLRAGCTMQEVERLAATMSLKNGVFGIPAGGAKVGLDCNPRDPDAADLLERFVRALAPIFSTCLATGEDLGTSQRFLNEVWARAGLGLPVEPSFRRGGDPAEVAARVREAMGKSFEGISLVDVIGGYGAAQAALAAIEWLGWDRRQRSAAIQGFGSMGGPVALLLSRAGIRVVAIADVAGTVANPSGLDVEALYQSRSTLGDVDRKALRAADARLPGAAWLEAGADILIPAAIADVINESNCEEVTAGLIVEAANIPTTAAAARRLQSRGVTVVPDFIANASTNVWYWWVVLREVEPTSGAAFEKVATTMRQTVSSTLSAAAARAISPREAAESAAFERLDRMALEFTDAAADSSGIDGV
jgi:glutamate dehydrogenase (NAD(P)+)